jgi:hypothetical protein
MGRLLSVGCARYRDLRHVPPPVIAKQDPSNNPTMAFDYAFRAIKTARLEVHIKRIGAPAFRFRPYFIV